MIGAVLFDLDGLVFDDEKFTILSKVIEARKLGFDVKEEDVKKTLGMSEKFSREFLASKYGKDFPYDFLRSKRIEYIFADMKKNGFPLKKGFVELMAFLKSTRIKTALVTSSRHEYIEMYKNIGPLFEEFDCIITGDMIEHGKPEPDGYLLACKSLGVKPTECLILEDSLNGLLAGNNAGIPVIIIPDLVEITEEMKNKAVSVLDSLKDVIYYIKEKEFAIMETISLYGETYYLESLVGSYDGYDVYKAVKNGQTFSLYRFKDDLIHIMPGTLLMNSFAERYNTLHKIKILMPRLIDKSLFDKVMILEMIDGTNVKDLIVNDEMPMNLYFQLAQIYKTCKKKRVPIDFNPQNFVYQNGLLFYTKLECAAYNMNVDFFELYMTQWIPNYGKMSSEEQHCVVSQLKEKYFSR